MSTSPQINVSASTRPTLRYLLQTRLALVVFGMATLAVRCSCSPATIAPPRIPQGGRTLSIAVASTDAKRMVAATETGGLFRTFDGGKSWQHLDGLPNYKTRDVAIASLNPNLIIATTEAQYRTLNDGGIWRSTDGGGIWSQPTGWAPPPGLNCPSRPGAFGISHMPLSRTFFVGTDCGIAVSNDDGATWTHFVLNPTEPGLDPLKHRVRSLLVINNTSGVAAADLGLFFLAPNGVWTKAQDVDSRPIPRVPVLHAFAAPWWNSSSIFFHASEGQKLWLSTDGGATWSQIEAPSNNNREGFVRVARSVDGNDPNIDVYFGDGVNLNRQSFSFKGTTGLGDGWRQLVSDHTDPSDIAVDFEQRIPILLASDGGVHVTTDKGHSWKLTGGGFGGFNALQISDVTGQFVRGPNPHLDLYFGTQDNGLWASADGGHTWPTQIDGEGRFIGVDPTSTDERTTHVTGLVCGNCSTFLTDAHFTNQRSWPDAPAGIPGTGRDAPFLILRDSYLQYTKTSGPPFEAFLTLSAGSVWSKAFSLPLEPKGTAIFAGSLANPIVYQGVHRPGALPNGGFRFGLVRVNNLTGAAVVVAADSAGIGSFGSLRTPISMRVVVGVDPNDANHLIAADVENSEMKFSSDGGLTWFPLPQLTQAVTGNGDFLFTIGDRSLATVISWDPQDSCHILVGTNQNGIIRSTDGGNTWSQIEGSSIVTKVTSFFYPPTGPVWVSTNGRGLWNLDIRRATGADPRRCRFPEPPIGGILLDSVVAIDPNTGESTPFLGPSDPIVCPQCAVVVVHNGWITNLQLQGNSVSQVAISGGTISAIDPSGRETLLPVPNRYQVGDGRFTLRTIAPAAIASRRIRGLVVEGNQLLRLIAARDELSFAPPRTPLVFAFSAVDPGRPAVFPGELAQVIGTDFLPASRGGEGVQIRFENEVVASDVQVRDDGSFLANVPVHQLPGEIMVTVEQHDGQRLTIERTILEVLLDDER